MDWEKKCQEYRHFAAAAVGGFFGGYSIFNFCDLFANAQTANLIHLIENVIGADFSALLYGVISLITYMTGNVFCVLYKRYGKHQLRRVSLLISLAAVFAVGIIVQFARFNYAVLPILFAMPIQWNAFNDDAGYASSTIFSTNNLRQATMSLVNYIIDKDKKQLSKTKFFWKTLLFYHIGVAYACVLSLFFGVQSIWFGFLPIAVAFVFVRSNKKYK